MAYLVLAACVDYQLQLVDHALVSAMSVPYELSGCVVHPELGSTVDCDCDCEGTPQAFFHLEPIFCHFYSTSIATEIQEYRHVGQISLPPCPRVTPR